MMYLYFAETDNKINNFNHDFIVKNSIRQLRGRGIATRIIKSEDELKASLKSNEDCLFIPYSFPAAYHSLLLYCNKKNIPIITVHVYPQYFPDCTYNTITRDPFACMRNILAYFIYNKGDNPKISYFGMSPNTLVDQAKMNAIYSLYSPMEKEDFYYNDTGFIDCFEKFYERRHEYDAVICANTNIAIAFLDLMKERDPKTAKRLMVVSFLRTKIAELYHTPITISAYNDNSIYDSVAVMYKNIKKQEYVQTMNFILKTKLLVKESSGNMLCPPEELVYDLTSKYYSGNRNVSYKTEEEVLVDYSYDPYLKNIILVGNLLDFADELDLKIINMFLKGYKNNDISNKLWISIQTVQYRSREMFKILGVSSKVDFVDILSKYISVERLQRYILDSTLDG